MNRISFLFILLLPAISSAQNFNLQNKLSAYQSKDNVLYWKNRTPFAGYWQQDVAYDINASINDTTDIIDGNLSLLYFNNSPDTLSFVYFHLYQNAFQPGSYLDDLQKNNRERPKYGKYESNGLGTKVESMKVSGQELKHELDNTVLKVFLTQPLLPNTGITFEIKFKTYFDNGSTRRRMKKFDASGFKHYDGVHWYPRICVYDRKLGWDTDQHLNREFYGDFGSFDVELNFPNNYIVDATGTLQNREEVMPDSLRKKLDIKNFKDKKFGTRASVVVPKDSTRKTWKFQTKNVHDFAWTADPTYRISETEWNGVKVIALAQEPNAPKWQNAAEYAAKAIQVYSEDIGMYAWEKIIVADARDGMEYPMLTLDGGTEPGYHSVLTHEIGHMWFFGMVGNNETYRAALDEGFTQFLTSWSMTKLDGNLGVVEKNKSKYVERFTERQSVRERSVYSRYISDAILERDPQLNTHSDQFGGALNHGGGYSHVYFKTATMLYNLQYVLGDELFLNSMRHYFSKWKMCHPYFEDFRSSIIEYTHTDLNWFFDEWMETSKNIDYEISSVKSGKGENEFLITFRRKGRMQMPLDFTVFSKTDSVLNFHIPNSWFVKKTDAIVLPRWIGWDKLKPTYTASVNVPGGIYDVVIDTSGRLADVNMLDNSYKFPYKFSFDSKISTPADRMKYEILARPDVWYNAYDGVKIGMAMSGNYMRTFNIFDLAIGMNTGLVQMNIPKELHNGYDQAYFVFNYLTSTDKYMKNSSVNLMLKQLDGLKAVKAGFDRKDRTEKNKLSLNVKMMYRESAWDKLYLLYPGEWQEGLFNNTLNAGYEHLYSYFHGTGNISLALRSSTIGSDYDYSYATLTVVNKSTVGKLDFNTRTFLQYGTGSRQADESALFLAGANPEEMMDNKYIRSRGFVDNAFLGYGETTNHFQYGGGLNLRGYAGYLGVEELHNGGIRTTYKGNSGASVSAELGFDRLVSIKPKVLKNYFHLSTYLFGDAGLINVSHYSEALQFSDPRADAGLGLAFTIKKFGALQTVKPLVIRLDMPLFLSRTPDVEPDFFKLRWLVGVNRCF